MAMITIVQPPGGGRALEPLSTIPWEMALPPERSDHRVEQLRVKLEAFGVSAPRYPAHWPATKVEVEFGAWLWRRWERGSLPEGLMDSLDRDREAVALHESAHVAVAEAVDVEVEISAIIHSIPRPIGLTKLVTRPTHELRRDLSRRRLSKELRNRTVVSWAGMVFVPELGRQLDGDWLREMSERFGTQVDELAEVARDVLRSPEVERRRAEVEATLVGSEPLSLELAASAFGVWEDEGNGPILEFGPYRKVWEVSGRTGARWTLDPLELYNRVVAQWTGTRGLVQVEYDADPDPLPGLENEIQVNLAGLTLDPDSASLTAWRILQAALKQRYRGTISTSRAFEAGTGRDAVYEVRPGDLVRITDFSADGSITLRIADVEYSPAGISIGIEAPAIPLGALSTFLGGGNVFASGGGGGAGVVRGSDVYLPPGAPGAPVAPPAGTNDPYGWRRLLPGAG